MPRRCISAPAPGENMEAALHKRNGLGSYKQSFAKADHFVVRAANRPLESLSTGTESPPSHLPEHGVDIVKMWLSCVGDEELALIRVRPLACHRHLRACGKTGQEEHVPLYFLTVRAR